MPFDTLADAIAHPDFPAVDLALRRGYHIDPRDADWYAYVHEAREHLEAFYARYNCDLVYRTDDFCFLVPRGAEMGRQHLDDAEMLVGQMLALMRIDPSTIASGGVVTTTQVIDRLDGLLGLDGLVQALRLYHSDSYDERRGRERVLAKLRGALRRLRRMGFIETEDARHRLRAALTRFMDPVRDARHPAVALERLVAAGRVVVRTDEIQPDDARYPMEEADAVEADDVVESDDKDDTP